MVDITIRGAGIFGLSIAWACVQRGASVQVIDPNGVGSGASGGIVGALAPHVPEKWSAKKAFQLESLLMAEPFWREVEEVGGLPSGYARTGRLQPIADSAALELAQRRSETAKALWQSHASWQVMDVPETSWHPRSPTGQVIHDTLSAHLHPKKSCLALAAALAQKGVAILPEGNPLGKTLWATGVAGLEHLTQNHTRLIGAGEKGQAVLLEFDATGAPQLFAGGVHVIPHLDGTVAIGSTTERYFEQPHTTDSQLEDVITAARAAVPALKDAPVLHRWAGLRPRSRSRAPMLGAYPGKPGEYIANGGFKIGFGMAPKIAEVMADLMLEGVDNIPDGFRVEDNL